MPLSISDSRLRGGALASARLCLVDTVVLGSLSRGAERREEFTPAMNADLAEDRLEMVLHGVA